MSGSDPKRRRLSPSPDPYAISDDDSTPYVPVKQRRQQLLTKLASKNVGVAASASALERQREEEQRLAQEEDERNGKKQKGTAQTLLMEAQEVKKRKALEGESSDWVSGGSGAEFVWPGVLTGALSWTARRGQD